jgi:DNA-binding FrmR family transcriptional regulator
MGRQGTKKVPRDPDENIMRNKQLYIRRIERMEGTLRAIEVSLGQRDTTLQSIRQRLEIVNNELDELRGMVEREN